MEGEYGSARSSMAPSINPSHGSAMGKVRMLTLACARSKIFLPVQDDVLVRCVYSLLSCKILF
jgi:hypothetical protein